MNHAHETIVSWFGKEQRPLPWRDPSTSPWAILVSEIMSQQTPVSRVEPRWREWMQRWPTPADLAAAPTAEVLHRWDRLGYPRRALRLQEAAQAIVTDFDGTVPSTEAELSQLPGIGAYTAAAVASFAFGQRATVLDTNVRRVLIRLFAGRDRPSMSPGKAESAWAAGFVPSSDHVQWNAGVMEFGALVCTARTPQCAECPLATICAWNAAGRPAAEVKTKTQKWAGTDRQLRGAIMDALKAAHNGSTPGADSEEPCVQSTTSIPVDLFTVPVTQLDPQLFEDLAPTTSAAVHRVRELSADTDRIGRLVEDLIKDGLAARSGDALSLPI